MLKSMKHFEESAIDVRPIDLPENDPPIYSIPSGSGANSENDFFNPGGWLTATEELPTPAPPQASSFTATALIVAALLFLLLNVVAFGFIFYQRGKLRMRENLFRNRFRCKTISVPDLFDDSADIYAVAESRPNCATPAKPKVAKRRSSAVDYRSGRVASIKPEAMKGKRMRRWPLSKQCSSSTIDAHSKVRDWIVNEVATVAAAARSTPRFGRKSKKARVDELREPGAIEMRTIERHKETKSIEELFETTVTSPLNASVGDTLATMVKTG